MTQKKMEQKGRVRWWKVPELIYRVNTDFKAEVTDSNMQTYSGNVRIKQMTIMFQ